MCDEKGRCIDLRAVQAESWRRDSGQSRRVSCMGMWDETGREKEEIWEGGGARTRAFISQTSRPEDFRPTPGSTQTHLSDVFRSTWQSVDKRKWFQSQAVPFRRVSNGRWLSNEPSYTNTDRVNKGAAPKETDHVLKRHRGTERQQAFQHEF